MNEKAFDATAYDALLLQALPPESVFAVGGRVRDEIRARLGQAPLSLNDADYVVTGISFDEIAALLERHGRVDRVGANFSVIKFTRDGTTIDVALPRREISTGSGHRDFRIESGPEVPLVDDLSRRDFRMNMIARSLTTNEIIDPYCGTADIADRRIDILHERTFEEDPLRMLRACQFAARFGYTISERTHAGILTAHALASSISPQRISEELGKLLKLSAKPSVGIELLRTTKLLQTIWPEIEEGFGIEQNEWHAYDIYRHNLETLDAMPRTDMISRLAALLHDVGKPRVKDGPHFYRHELVGAEMVTAMLRRTAFSNEVVETTAHLVRHHMYSCAPVQTDAAIRRFIRRIGPTHIPRLFALRAADICGSGLPKRNDDNERFQERVSAALLESPAISIADLAVTGEDVIQAFIAAGTSKQFRGDRRVGIILQQLLEQVIEIPANNTRTFLLKCIADRVANC